MKKQTLFKTFLFLSLGTSFFVACGDDETSTNVDESSVIEKIDTVYTHDSVFFKDSVVYGDSVYYWYIQKNQKADPESSGSAADSSKKDPDENAEEDDDDESGIYVPQKAALLPPGGFYKSLTIPVPAAMQNGKIRCAFGGYSADESSEEFVEPLEITKTTVVRCTEFVDGEAVRSSSQTYFFGEDVGMPVVAISVNPYSMFDSKDGYYRQGVRSCSEPCYEANYWWDLELPVHVEFFDLDGTRAGAKSWEIDAGLSIMGAWSRIEDKKSVSISMRKEYQDGRLKYPIFKTRPEDKKFKGFNLRNNGNRFVGDYIEDAMLSSLLEGSGVDYQRSRQVVVFYNGDYYGIHDLRERINEHFIETNHKIDSKVVNMVKHVGDSLSVSGGVADDYVALQKLIAAADFSGANNKDYAKASEMMDMGNYADYMTAEIYYHNGDWPDNNVRAWNAPGVPFRFIIFDLDHGFGWDWSVSGFNEISENMFGWIRQGGHNECNTPGCFANFYVKLSENPDFRRLFANHGAVMLDYYLTYDRVVAATRAITATIPESDMNRDQNHYAGGRRSYHSFDKTGQTLIDYANGRSEIVRDEYRKEFSLGADIKVTLKAEGSGQVLLDGMKLPKSDYTGTFFAGNDMLLTAEATDGSVFKEWEDGSTENPRLVSPKDGSSFKAIFK